VLKIRIRNPQNLLFGLFLIGIGILGIAAGWDLSMGDAAQMGPGYMPKILSGILVAFGVVISLSGLKTEGQSLGRWAWGPAAVVTGAVVLFGVAIEPLGLALTSFMVVLVATVAAPDRQWRQALPFGLALALACVAVFRIGLGLPLRVWPF
jgi:hypothetical protein